MCVCCVCARVRVWVCVYVVCVHLGVWCERIEIGTYGKQIISENYMLQEGCSIFLGNDWTVFNIRGFFVQFRFVKIVLKKKFTKTYIDGKIAQDNTMALYCTPQKG